MTAVSRAAGYGLWAIGTATVCGVAVLVSPIALAAVPAVLLLSAFVAVGRREHLLPAALVSFALVPVSYLPLPFPGQFLALSNLLVIAYLVTARGERVPWLRGAYVWAVVALTGYLLVVTATSGPASMDRKAAWLLALVAILLAPPLVATSRATFDTLLTTLALVGSALAGFAIVEHLTQANPLAPVFAMGPYPLEQEWGVYRVMTSLGHPLLNATFFAMVAVVGLGGFLVLHRWWGLPVTALGSVAVVLTASRSGAAALVVGLGCLLAGSVRRMSAKWVVKVAAIVVIILVAWVVLAQSPLAARLDSPEGRSSAGLRDRYPSLIVPLLEASDYVGTGPGSSDLALRKVSGTIGGAPLESSALQILVSLGVVGTLLLLVAVATLVAKTVGRGAIIGPSVLAAYGVSAAGYNLFEAYPAALVLPAVALVLCVAEVGATARRDRSSPSPADPVDAPAPGAAAPAQPASGPGPTPVGAGA